MGPAAPSTHGRAVDATLGSLMDVPVGRVRDAATWGARWRPSHGDRDAKNLPSVGTVRPCHTRQETLIL